MDLARAAVGLALALTATACTRHAPERPDEPCARLGPAASPEELAALVAKHGPVVVDRGFAWRCPCGPQLAAGPGLMGDQAGPGLAGDQTGPGLMGDQTGPGLMGDQTGPGLMGDQTGPGLMGDQAGPGLAGGAAAPGLAGAATGPGLMGAETVPALRCSIRPSCAGYVLLDGSDAAVLHDRAGARPIQGGCVPP